MPKALKGAVIARLALKEPHLLGVGKKLWAQSRALADREGTVDLYYVNDTAVMCNTQELRRFGSGKLWRKLTYYFLFYIYLAGRLEGLDFVYVRYPRSSPLFLWFLRRLRRRNPGLVVIIELPSYPYHTEYVTLRDKVFGWIDQMSRRHLHKYTDRIVTFSREPEILDVPTICTDNGVDPSDLSPIPVQPNGDTLYMCGVANLSHWHGYDRVIAGLKSYYVERHDRNVVFDIVGTGAELERLKKDAESAGLEAVVKFHGARQGDELQVILSRCHLGISSIGMHRLDVDTSNLKSREFCARGLPFVIAYADRDFNQDLPFVFQAPADDTPLNIKAVLGFYDKLHSQCADFDKTMRTYAEENLTWGGKMAPVLKYIITVKNT